MLDRFEPAEELSEDAAGEVTRGELAEEERGGHHDDERTANPQGERKPDDLRGGLEHVSQSTFPAIAANVASGDLTPNVASGDLTLYSLPR